jgi:hypothetical protein
MTGKKLKDPSSNEKPEAVVQLSCLLPTDRQVQGSLQNSKQKWHDNLSNMTSPFDSCH